MKWWDFHFTKKCSSGYYTSLNSLLKNSSQGEMSFLSIAVPCSPNQQWKYPCHWHHFLSLHRHTCLLIYTLCMNAISKLCSEKFMPKFSPTCIVSRVGFGIWKQAFIMKYSFLELIKLYQTRPVIIWQL